MNKKDFIGIDAGGTYFKAGNPFAKLESNSLPFDRFRIKKLIECTKQTLLTGAGSNTILQWFPERKIKVFNEFQCTGFGAKYLSKMEECLVLNIGSGTPILHVAEKVTHLSGTGLGSATIVGLSKLILGVERSLPEIMTLASTGDPTKVNLLVGDLYEHSEKDIGLPGDITASNFGKYQYWTKTARPKINDLIAGLHVMVAESLAVIVTQTSKSFSPTIPIVITGGGTLNTVLLSYITKTFTYLEKDFIIPENAIYATLYGLFVLENVI